MVFEFCILFIMKTYYNYSDLKDFLEQQKITSLGFVPTMGALHPGHLSLLKASFKNHSHTICTIFVNPLQFDKKEDFESYPKNYEKDLSLLRAINCPICYLPDEKKIYPYGRELIEIELGPIASEMEGAFRPGHFLGVVSVIKRFFDLIKPDTIYLGEKDFQQILVIKKLIEKFSLPIKVTCIPTLREPNGLAMSSRNIRLDASQKKEATLIYRALKEAKNLFFQKIPIREINYEIKEIFAKSPLDLEYFTIADERLLIKAEKIEPSKKYRAFIAAYLLGVRLIDNMAFY